jgi:hypothetical protein
MKLASHFAEPRARDYGVNRLRISSPCGNGLVAGSLGQPYKKNVADIHSNLPSPGNPRHYLTFMSVHFVGRDFVFDLPETKLRIESFFHL